MSTTNIYRRLRELLPDAPTLYAQVLAVHADGTASVQHPGGAVRRVRNPFDAAAGASVYVQGDAIAGSAPALGAAVLIEI